MALSSLVDASLLQSWKNGDERAYGKLFDRYFVKLYNYSLRYLSDALVSEEIVMDVMMNVWQKRDSIDADRSISGYLFSSIRNRLIDHFRKQTVIVIPFELVNAQPVASTSADDIILEKEMDGIYRRGLASLPTQKKRIFTLSREEGRSYREIAAKLGLSQKTVENHMVAALRIFRTYLEKRETFKN